VPSSTCMVEERKGVRNLLMKRIANTGEFRRNRLVLVSQTGDAFELTADQVTIGRSSRNILRISNPYVSRQHAEVWFDGRQHFVVDLGSTNATKLNGQRLQPGQLYLLHHGSTLTLADQVTFAVEIRASEQVLSEKRPLQTRPLIVALAGMAFTLLLVFLLLLLYPHFRDRLSRDTEPEIVDVKLPPPLASVDFPLQVIDYPTEWPSDLRYPAQFVPVETTSGDLPGSVARGWGTKLVHQGDAGNAADKLSAFFISNGWQIIERTELDSGGYLLSLQRHDRQDTGAVVIDPDTEQPGHIKIIITVFQ